MSGYRGALCVYHKKLVGSLGGIPSDQEIIDEAQKTDRGIEALLGEHSSPAVVPTEFLGTHMIYTLQHGSLVHIRRTDIRERAACISNSLIFGMLNELDGYQLVRNIEDMFEKLGYFPEARMIIPGGN